MGSGLAGNVKRFTRHGLLVDVVPAVQALAMFLAVSIVHAGHITWHACYHLECRTPLWYEVSRTHTSPAMVEYRLLYPTHTSH